MLSTPVTFDELHSHLLNYEPAARQLKSLARANADVVQVDDVNQLASIEVFKLWQKAEVFGIDTLGNEVRTVDLQQSEGWFIKNCKRAITNAVRRSYRPDPVPERPRSKYVKIRRKAEQVGVHPRDLAESMGMSLDEFDRITAWVGMASSVNITDRDEPRSLYDYVDSMVEQGEFSWLDLVDYVQGFMVSEAREVLTPEQDEIIEIFYYELSIRAASDAAVADVLTEVHEQEGRRFTPRYVAPIHREAIHAMQHKLQAEHECGDE